MSRGMAMKLQMTPAVEPRLLMKCKTCIGHWEDHEENCPRGKLREFLHQRPVIGCPECKKRAVSLNMTDLWECRSCHTQYTTGVAPGGEEDAEQVVLMNYSTDDAILALQLKMKGDGQFCEDVVVSALKKEIKRWEARKQNG